MKKRMKIFLIMIFLVSGCCLKFESIERDYIDSDILCVRNGISNVGMGLWEYGEKVNSIQKNVYGYYLKDSLIKDSSEVINRALTFTCDGYWYFTMLDKIFMQKNDSSCFCWNADYNPKENCLHPGSNFKKENFKYWTEDNGKILVLQACGYPSQNDTVPRLFQMKFKIKLSMRKKACSCPRGGVIYLFPINYEARRFRDSLMVFSFNNSFSFILNSNECLE